MPASASMCGAGSSNAPKTDAATATITKGATKTVNGVPHLSGRLRLPGQAALPALVATTLPHEMASGGATMTYSNWNNVAPIEAPK